MPRTTLLIALVLLAALPASGQKWVNVSYPWAFVEHHPAAEMIDDTRDYFVYGTERGMLFFLERDRMTGALKMVKQREVWAPVKELQLAECTGDGRNELVAVTRNGDLFVIGLGNMKDLWRTPEGYFQSIYCFSVADVDADDKPEIVLIADEKLVIMSGDSDTEEWRSAVDFTATHMVIADVDADGQLEIVLNTGKVLDARFRQLEWEFEGSFGPVMDVFDIDGDGILEIVGQGPNGEVQVVEADQRRVKWE